MKRIFRLFMQVILVTCTFTYCTDGFSIGSERFRRQLSKRIDKHGFGLSSILNNVSNGYQLMTNFAKSRFNGNAQQKQARQSGFTGSSALSGVPNCENCFMGLQVSQREAYVVGI